MKLHTLLLLAGLCTGLLFANMSGLGGCGSAGSAAPPIDIPSTASIASLSTVPSMDLSTLDTSASSSAALILGKAAKNLGEDLRAEGKSSRAGCEANAHKDEIFRMSQMAQLDRCYPEAMETAGIITIPEGRLALYAFTPPEENAGDVEKMCDDIPDERTEEKTACEEGGGGLKNVKFRLGIIDGVLQIDMCKGEADGSESLVHEASYEADGSVYAATITRIGNFLGDREGSTFTMTVDLGTTGEVTDGLVTLGDGSASASARMNSRSGNGLISFGATASSNSISGAFAGNFTDPFTGVTTTFTGRAHSEFGPSDGCAKFRFEGSPPPMRVKDMIPFDIPADQLSGFLRTLGLELGINLTAANYQTTNLCPNPSFDPKNFDEAIKPMVATNDDGGCPTVTHTGLECFAISTGATTTDFESTEVSQIFTIIANTASSFYDAVNAFDLSALDPTVDTVAFARNWDCTGSFTVIGTGTVTVGQANALREELQKCVAIQEKAFNRQGMGGYNCNQQEQMNGVNDMSEEGPPDFGPYGGEYLIGAGAGTTCPPNIGLPEKLFASVLDVEGGEYCLPISGNCQSFQVTVGPPPTATGLTIDLPVVETAITNLQYDQPDPNLPAESVLVTYSGPELAPLGGSCHQRYTIQHPTFEALPEFGSGESPPQACIDTFGNDVTQEECQALCAQPDHPCAI